MPGYVHGGHFDVVDCEACGTAAALPQTVPPGLYESIYSHAHAIPSYGRYQRYADEVEGKSDALAYLADQEEAYWAVAELVAERPTPGRALRVLEIGCGLGYLTYALHRAGFDATGLEHSSRAVETAERRFGPHYVCGTLEEYAAGRGPCFDLVILTEVLEHVPAVVPLLEQAVALLTEDGALLVTTPNRSFYDRQVLWETDLPPVHLWWFGRRSIELLAGRVERSVRFLSLAPFYSGHHVRVRRRFAPGRPSRQPVLTPDLTPLPDSAHRRTRPFWWRALWSAASTAGLLPAYRRVRARLGSERCTDDGPVLAAVLEP
jgi:SAM-dependent methyltransferase